MSFETLLERSRERFEPTARASEVGNEVFESFGRDRRGCLIRVLMIRLTMKCEGEEESRRSFSMILRHERLRKWIFVVNFYIYYRNLG